MDYFQGVVQEYLSRRSTTTINSEFWISLDYHKPMPVKGTSWYTDILACDTSDQAIYLCEVSYSKGLAALIKRLTAWNAKWPDVQGAVYTATGIARSFSIRPWLFVPADEIEKLVPKISTFAFTPKITPLEMACPWKYEWKWTAEKLELKPLSIPPNML